MGKLHSCFVVGILALAAACGDDGGAATKMDAAVDAPPDAKVFMDAPPPMFDLTCMGNAAPTTATAMITLSGTARQADLAGLALDIQPIDGATVKACDTAACNGMADGSDTTDPNGDWSIAPITTGGTPLNDYLELTGTGVRTTFVYPGAPFVADQGMIPVFTFGPMVQLILDGAGCPAADPIVVVFVTDCSNAPLADDANVDIIVKQGGAVVPNVETTAVSSFPGAPPEAGGLWLVCGVPANAATNIGAQYNGMDLLAHDVKTVANTTTTTLIRPGY
jgi:hypothetical protein